jgi:FlaA1/EpsC-like NDP-sugar epimerase
VPNEILLVALLGFIAVGRISGVYDSLTRFYNFSELKKYIFLLFAFSLIITFFSSRPSFQQWFVLFFSSICATIPYRFLIKQLNSSTDKIQSKKTLIFSACKQGVFLKRSFFNSEHIQIVGFIDDNSSLQGRKIDGVYVYGLGDKLDRFIKNNNVSYIIFSTPKISSQRKLFLTDYFNSRGLKTFNSPVAENWIGQEKISPLRLKQIRIEDILSRPEIDVDNELNQAYYKGSKILITGGAGSIGSELVIRLLSYKPKKIVVIDFNETALFFLQNKINFPKNIEFLLMNVLDETKLSGLFEKENFDYVFHASAYKHVSVVENNPEEALRNNILGTFIVSTLSMRHNIKKFVLVSTDKAVNPTNLMGASKRFCELLVNVISRISNNKTQFITTRFGNVMGSNGSVIPIFREQIANGGPITLTHPEITRYFMTIPEASKLVIESGRIGRNNQVLVFDMGKPIKIIDIARNMISLSGCIPVVDIDIEIIGLRPGEKLYEELLLNTEKMTKSSNPYLFIADREHISSDTEELIFDFCSKLKCLKGLEILDLIADIKQIIPEYISNNSPFEILDHTSN